MGQNGSQLDRFGALAKTPCTGVGKTNVSRRYRTDICFAETSLSGLDVFKIVLYLSVVNASRYGDFIV